MKTLQSAFLSSVLILTFATGFTQARLGYTFDEIDKEFVVDGYGCLDKKFGKNVGYGYHFYIQLDGGSFCHYLSNDMICFRGLFIPNDDTVFYEYVKVYDNYKNTEKNDNVWIVHDINYTQSMKIEAITSKNNSCNIDKKYFEYTLINN